MSSITYYQVIKENQNPFGLRVRLINHVLKHGQNSASKEFSCNIKTVRKWVKRFKEKGLKGLKNLSRRPHNSPNKTSRHEIEEIEDLRRSLKRISAQRMIREFGIKRAKSTTYRIIKNMPDYKVKRWKKHKKKQDLRKIKEKLKPFEKIQIDTKELRDIPNYWPYMQKRKLPKYQFTARDVKTGALFFSFSHSKSATNSAAFCAYLLEHLKRFGIDINKVKIQTDNGTEFVGNWRPNSFAPFNYLIEEIYKAVHERIPPSAPTYNSDVETSHARIEEELYDIEEFEDLSILKIKAFSYQVYFNLIRPNTYRKEMSPLQIIEKEKGPINPYLLVLQPIVLEKYAHLYFNKVKKHQSSRPLHHVPILPSFIIPIPYNLFPRV